MKKLILKLIGDSIKILGEEEVKRILVENLIKKYPDYITSNIYPTLDKFEEWINQQNVIYYIQELNLNSKKYITKPIGYGKLCIEDIENNCLRRDVVFVRNCLCYFYLEYYPNVVKNNNKRLGIIGNRTNWSIYKAGTLFSNLLYIKDKSAIALRDSLIDYSIKNNLVPKNLELDT